MQRKATLWGRTQSMLNMLFDVKRTPPHPRVLRTSSSGSGSGGSVGSASGFFLGAMTSTPTAAPQMV
eukprot:366521-Chlamydomonas_euryale.AAC.2